MAALEESARLSKLLIGPFTRGLSHICLNARFATEPCANVTMCDHMVSFPIYGNSTLKRRRGGRADKSSVIGRSG